MNKLQNSQQLPQLKLPLIPPKPKHEEVKAFDFSKDDDSENWYYVKSPREIHGAQGPLPVSELRSLYRVGDIGDNTLMWEEQLEEWSLLKDLSTLRHKLVFLPLIPPRLGSSFEDTMINPIMNPPAVQIASTFKETKDYIVSCACSRCGSFAANHVQEAENILPAFGFIRSAIGNTKEAGEVIPGFLYVGNSTSSKPR